MKMITLLLSIVLGLSSLAFAADPKDKAGENGRNEVISGGSVAEEGFNADGSNCCATNLSSYPLIKGNSYDAYLPDEGGSANTPASQEGRE